MIRITLKSGIVVEGTLATNQVATEKPSVTVITNYPKVIKTYKTNKSYTTGNRHKNGYDIVEYKSHEYIEKEVKQNTTAVIMEETIANREVLELL